MRGVGPGIVAIIGRELGADANETNLIVHDILLSILHDCPKMTLSEIDEARREARVVFRRRQGPSGWRGRRGSQALRRRSLAISTPTA